MDLGARFRKAAMLRWPSGLVTASDVRRDAGPSHAGIAATSPCTGEAWHVDE
jgi:hypothetical protein